MSAETQSWYSGAVEPDGVDFGRVTPPTIDEYSAAFLALGDCLLEAPTGELRWIGADRVEHALYYMGKGARLIFGESR